MNLDKTITWGEMARGLGVILVLGAVGVAVAWMPHAARLLFGIVGVVVTGFGLSAVWMHLKNNQAAKVKRHRRGF
jgi:CHASE2 domain-containing sensor protein